MNECITPNYETIGVKEIRNLRELCGSSVVYALSKDDYNDILNVFLRIVERLEGQPND